MGEENRADDLVVYADGQPVGHAGEIEMVTLTEVGTMPEECVMDLQVSVTDKPPEEVKGMEDSLAPFSMQMTISCKEAEAAMEEITRQAAAARGAIQAFFRRIVEVWEEIQLREAVRWAEAYNRPLAWRYHHTKKKRTRKKYAKRIMAWYRGD